ncbi:MAG TPA: hypothetical protein VMT54_11215 [Candidatus Cybelea sp.]|nr:hypothetical protein [Candidatus Cybelea sp.]
MAISKSKKPDRSKHKAQKPQKSKRAKGTELGDDALEAVTGGMSFGGGVKIIDDDSCVTQF